MLPIKPGAHPFSVIIDFIATEPIDKDSIDFLSPGAYIIIKNDWTLVCSSLCS